MEGFVLGGLLLATAIIVVMVSRSSRAAAAKAAVEAQAAADAKAAAEAEAETPKKKKKKKKTSASPVEGEAKAEPITPASLEAAMQAIAARTREPRRQHYLFAHRLLPNVMLGEGGLEAIRAAIAKGDGDDAIGILWEGAGKMALAMDGEREVIPGAPKVETIDRGVLVRMPEACGMTEAHFIAIVEQDSDVRYFILEDSVDKPVLCEWTKDGVHRNTGDKLAPTSAAFLAAVRARTSN